MRRGVLYGVLAFGLAVSLGAFTYALATGASLGAAARIFGVLFAALLLVPLEHLAVSRHRNSDQHGTLAVALLVFALLSGAGGVIVGIVGGEPWFGAAAALVGTAVVTGTAGALVPDDPLPR